LGLGLGLVLGLRGWEGTEFMKKKNLFIFWELSTTPQPNPNPNSNPNPTP